MSAKSQRAIDSEALHQLAIEHSPVALLVATAPGTISLANTQAATIFDCSQGELVGKPIEHLFAFTEEQNAERDDLKGLSPAQTHSRRVNLRARRSDGSYFAAEVELRSSQSQPRQVVFSIADLSQRDRSQQVMLESFQTYKLLFESIRDGVGVIQDHRFVLANSALARSVGYTLAEAMEIPFTKMISPEFSSALGVRYKKRMDGNNEPPAQTEVQLLCKDGTLGPWVEINAQKITFLGHPASLVVLRDITERVNAQHELQSLAMNDSLTGLANRHSFVERLDQDLRTEKRHRKKAAVLYLDLDGFKAINDRHGHAIGDSVLTQIAHRLRKCVRDMDMVGRIGGDEFVVLLTELDSESAVSMLATKMIGVINRPVDSPVGELHVGASIGIAIFPKHGEDAETLLQHADEAMYRVKQSGKNRAEFYS